jgi:hypothetical protein
LQELQLRLSLLRCNIHILFLQAGPFIENLIAERESPIQSLISNRRQPDLTNPPLQTALLLLAGSITFASNISQLRTKLVDLILQSTNLRIEPCRLSGEPNVQTTCRHGIFLSAESRSLTISATTIPHLVGWYSR